MFTAPSSGAPDRAPAWTEPRKPWSRPLQPQAGLRIRRRQTEKLLGLETRGGELGMGGIVWKCPDGGELERRIAAGAGTPWGGSGDMRFSSSPFVSLRDSQVGQVWLGDVVRTPPDYRPTGFVCTAGF